MSALVFGCPSCQQPFQVGQSQAGQVVQCPSCAQPVEIPANAFESAPAPQPKPTEEPIIFACAGCQGQFAITEEMDGQTVACPHCQAPALIKLPGSPEQESVAGPIIDTKIEVSRRQKKAARKRAKSAGKKDFSNLFAPGYQRPESPVESTSVESPPPTSPVSPPANRVEPTEVKLRPKRRVPKQNPDQSTVLSLIHI